MGCSCSRELEEDPYDYIISIDSKLVSELLYSFKEKTMPGIFTGKSKKLKKYLAEGVTIVDVRSKTEFEGGHLRNSINIPLDSLPKHIGGLDKSKPIVTCCASGVRSGSAKRMLEAQGFDVINGGGWMSLQRYEVY